MQSTSFPLLVEQTTVPTQDGGQAGSPGEPGAKSPDAEQQAPSGDEQERTSHAPSRRRGSKASAAARPQSSAASSRQPVQKVVYYQNRFISVTIDPVTGKVVEAGPPLYTGGTGTPTGRTTSAAAATGGAAGARQGSAAARPGTSAAGGTAPRPGAMSSAIEIDTMQPDPSGSGIAGRPPGAPPNQASKSGRFSHFKVPSCLKTCHMYMQDNRMKTGSAATKEELKDNNKFQDSQNLCLKKVLNIIFVTTGVSLFLAVVITIIYTSIGESPRMRSFRFRWTLGVPSDLHRVPRGGSWTLGWVLDLGVGPGPWGGSWTLGWVLDLGVGPGP